MLIFHADTDDLDNPLHGGQPVRTFEINKRIAQRHRVTVFTSMYPGAKRWLVREGVEYRRLGLCVPGFGLSPHLTFLATLGPRLLARKHDLVVEEFTPPVGFCLLPLWTSRPVISMVQWFFFEYWEKRYKLPFLKIMASIARKRLYHYFIVQSYAMKKTIMNYVPDATVKVIPCGINADCFLEPSSGGEFALFLGRLERYQKGLDMLIEIWRIICSRQKVPLIIAGDGLDKGFLERKIDGYCLKDVVKLVGMVGGYKKKKLLRECRFVVMPSREETFGMVALEAMAASKPVVAFDIPHLNEVLTPRWSVLAACFDLDHFASGVLNLWKDDDYTKWLGRNGQKQARNYLWDRLAVKQEEFYTEVLEGVH